MKDSALDLIGRFYAKNKTLPQAANLAAKFDISISEASEWIAEFEDKVKNMPLVKHRQRAPEEAPVQAGAKKDFNLLEMIIDSGSLSFAVVIDLVLNGIGFWIIGPEPIMKIGMVCISFIVVLFSVRAWIKGDKLLWAMFALVASFMDLSFILLATDVQSKNSGKTVQETELEDSLTKESGYLESLHSLQLKNGQGYAHQISDQQNVVDRAKKALEDYRSAPVHEETKMVAAKVFTAIPDAISSERWDRWIALSILSLVFIGLQLTIISAAGTKWRKGP
jgi:hypothetical protein